MGNVTLEQQIGTPIDNNIIALVITNQTEKVISKIETDPTNFFLREKINFRGDTLLHYACAKNNNKLVEYILNKNPELLHVKN
jgi:ankyrin repeat protein